MEATAPQVNLKRLPGSNLALIAGLLSLPLAFFGGVPGFLAAGLALWNGRKAKQAYQRDPGAWDFASFQNLSAGRALAQVGLVVSILSFYLFFGSFYAWFMGH